MEAIRELSMRCFEPRPRRTFSVELDFNSEDFV